MCPVLEGKEEPKKDDPKVEDPKKDDPKDEVHLKENKNCISGDDEGFTRRRRLLKHIHKSHKKR